MSNFENQISQLESQSLQAQMNPHFIFNVLNNIQSVLILKSEKEINYFMGHLSTLVRLTLNMSKQKQETPYRFRNQLPMAGFIQ